MKKRIFTAFLLLCFVATTAVSQQAKKEIFDNPYLSASNYLAYQGPSGTALTAPPKGYHPFYISHYGRHGSRYLIDKEDYEQPVRVLQTADSLGKLTDLGRDVLRRIRLMRAEASGRNGELTQLGAEQHKQIARRMFERFPDVFKGNADIDAKSTVVIRCILSMETELQELLILNPKLTIHHDASYHDMYFMNQTDNKLRSEKMPQRAKVALDEFSKKHSDCSRVMASLFNDDDYIRYEVDGERLNYLLFKLASNLQSSALGQEMTLYDIFTKDEIYQNWLTTNAYWYVNYGACPLNGGNQPFSQRNLLRNIISQADSCMALGTNGATLRFGHETMVLPLACLLGLNGYDSQIADLEQLEQQGWIDYKVFPMGSNIQLIFYRRSPNDPDVLVKVLLNEDEATLPIQSTLAPYYPWNAFKDYYLAKLDGYSN